MDQGSGIGYGGLNGKDERSKYCVIGTIQSLTWESAEDDSLKTN